MGGAQETAGEEDSMWEPATDETDSAPSDEADDSELEPQAETEDGTSADGVGALGQFRRGFNRTVRRLTGIPIGHIEPSEYESDERFSQETDPDLFDHPTMQAVLSDVKTYFEDTEELTFAEKPDPETLERRFFDFGYLNEVDEIERKWVNEPYAYVSVVEDPEESDQRYHVSEPRLDEYEQYIYAELTKILRNSLMYQDLGGEEQKSDIFIDRASDIIRRHIAAIPPTSMYKIRYYLERDFINYDRIDPLLRDAAIEDISCDGSNIPVFVYHKEYRDLDTNIEFDERELSSFVMRMAQIGGKHISISNPLVDASLPEGSRIQLSFGGDIATRGPNFTIRQFTPVPDTPIDLINWDTFNVEQMAYMWLAIENNRSLIFAGGTGSGKTTSLNAVSFFIPKKSKIVTIEDTPEISLPHENWVQGLTRDPITSGGEGEVTMYQQLQSALRQRPEYILVGEIRTEAQVAHTFFQAMATGHSAYTTLHSESVIGVINRLENEPLSVPTQLIKELDIISIQKQVLIDDERVRRTDRVTELVDAGSGSEDIHVNDVFEWDAETDSINTEFDSNVFDDIAADQGWTRTELREAYNDRRRVIEYMVDNDITWYEDVARVIHRFMTDPDKIIKQVENDTLDPASLVGQ